MRGAFLEEGTAIADHANGLRTTGPDGTPSDLSPAAQAAFGKVLGIHWQLDGTPVFRT